MSLSGEQSRSQTSVCCCVQHCLPTHRDDAPPSDYPNIMLPAFCLVMPLQSPVPQKVMLLFSARVRVCLLCGGVLTGKEYCTMRAQGFG